MEHAIKEYIQEYGYEHCYYVATTELGKIYRVCSDFALRHPHAKTGLVTLIAINEEQTIRELTFEETWNTLPFIKVSNIDYLANEFSKSHNKEIARYLGIYREKRTYMLTSKTFQPTDGDLPSIIQVVNENPIEFAFASIEEGVKIVAYFAENPDTEQTNL